MNTIVACLCIALFAAILTAWYLFRALCEVSRDCSKRLDKLREIEKEIQRDHIRH